MHSTESFRKYFLPVGLALTLFGLSTQAWAQNALEPGSSCGPAINTYGPFDYRSANQQQRSIVENAHFTRGVENLTGGGTGSIAKDIAYTLAVFPNHPRALLAMERLAVKEKRDPPAQVNLTVECWYERAIRWRGTDLVVRMMFADYLIRNKRTTHALAQLDFVSDRAGDNPFTHYNAGLLYLDSGESDKALRQAHRALALGMPRTELRDRLQVLGKWREPEQPSSTDPLPPSAPASQ